MPITQAEVTSITGYVYDRSGSDPHNAIATVSVSKSTTVYDALQTDDPRWTEDEQDAQGFNFAHAMPATSFPDPPVYRVVYKFIMVGSTDPLWVVYEPNAIRPAG